MTFRVKPKAAVKATKKPARNSRKADVEQVLIDERKQGAELGEGEFLASVTVAMDWKQTANYESVGVNVSVTLPVVLDKGAFRLDEPFDSAPIQKALQKAEGLSAAHLERCGKKITGLLKTND